MPYPKSVDFKHKLFDQLVKGMMSEMHALEAKKTSMTPALYDQARHDIFAKYGAWFGHHYLG